MLWNIRPIMASVLFSHPCQSFLYIYSLTSLFRPFHFIPPFISFHQFIHSYISLHSSISFLSIMFVPQRSAMAFRGLAAASAKVSFHCNFHVKFAWMFINVSMLESFCLTNVVNFPFFLFYFLFF